MSNTPVSTTTRLLAAWRSLRAARSFRTLALAAQIFVGGLLLWWLSQAFDIDPGRLVERVVASDYLALTLSVLCFVLTMVCAAARYRLFLPAHIGTGYMIGVALMQQAFLSFLPLRLGEVSYPIALRRDYAIPLLRSAAMLMAVRLADLGLMLGIALAASIRLGIDVRLVTALLGFGAALGAAGLCALWYLARDRLVGVGRSLTALVQPLRERRRLTAFLVLTAANIVFTTLQTSLILHALGLPLALLDVAAFNAISLLFALLPIHPPGGWGTTDTLQIFLLERLGHDAAVAAPIILAAHSLFTLLFALGGLIGWFIRGRTLAVIASGPARSAK